MRITKAIDRELSKLMWLAILFLLFWPLVIPWGLYRLICYLFKSYCSDCGRLFSMKNIKEVVTDSYWEKACLDGTADLRYKHNTKIEEYTAIYKCKNCSRTKSYNKKRSLGY